MTVTAHFSVLCLMELFISPIIIIFKQPAERKRKREMGDKYRDRDRERDGKRNTDRGEIQRKGESDFDTVYAIIQSNMR